MWTSTPAVRTLPIALTASPPSAWPFYIVRPNALQTADMVKAKMKDLSEEFPDGVVYEVGYDTTPFIRESIGEVFNPCGTRLFSSPSSCWSSCKAGDPRSFLLLQFP